MAQLIVRQLEDELAQQLKEQARKHGHSTEEEHRQILRKALKTSTSFKQALASIPVAEDGKDHDDVFERIPQESRDIAW